MIADLQTAFEQAQKDAQTLPKKPGNEVMLRLYSLYKQGTAGDAGNQRPEGFDFVGAAKYDAWDSLRGTPSAEAQRAYIELIQSLRASG